MKYRALRIAWTSVCVICCVLLCLLWARSYSYADDLVVTLTKAKQLEMQSVPGRCVLFIANAASRPISSFARYMSAKPEGAAHAYKHGVLGGDWAMSTMWVAHWILAVGFLALGVVPWARSLRFSLRTLLIATTLVGVALGAISYATGL